MKVQGFIVLVLVVSGGALVALVSQFSKWNEQSAQRRQEEQKAKQSLAIEKAQLPPRTVDDVPLSQLGGKFIRHWDGRGHECNIKEVKALSPTLFWITYTNGYGKECNLRYDAGVDKEKGRWEDGSSGEFGSFTIQRSNVDHRLWFGKMADNVEMTKHVDEFSVELQIR